jgi:hypothetical protein
MSTIETRRQPHDRPWKVAICRLFRRFGASPSIFEKVPAMRIPASNRRAAPL